MSQLYFPGIELWELIQQPAYHEFTSLDNPGDPRLFDYQLFREDIVYIWIRRLTDALRAVDRNHLISLGLIQYSAPVKKYEGNGARYAAFNSGKITPLLDYTSIHTYNWWDSHANTFIESIARYAYAGKPVLLEEYNLASSTPSVSDQVRSTSGWLHWGAFDVPGWDWKDNLFNENEHITSLGQYFNDNSELMNGRSPGSGAIHA